MHIYNETNEELKKIFNEGFATFDSQKDDEDDVSEAQPIDVQQNARQYVNIKKFLSALTEKVMKPGNGPEDPPAIIGDYKTVIADLLSQMSEEERADVSKLAQEILNGTSDI